MDVDSEIEVQAPKDRHSFPCIPSLAFHIRTLLASYTCIMFLALKPPQAEEQQEVVASQKSAMKQVEKLEAAAANAKADEQKQQQMAEQKEQQKEQEVGVSFNPLPLIRILSHSHYHKLKSRFESTTLSYFYITPRHSSHDHISHHITSHHRTTASHHRLTPHYTGGG